jgi:hypothetical protein
MVVCGVRNERVEVGGNQQQKLPRTETELHTRDDQSQVIFLWDATTMDMAMVVDDASLPDIRQTIKR